MSKDLTSSHIERQNILNNPYAVAEIERATNLRGIRFEGKPVLIKEQVADFFEVTTRTVDNYLARYEAEIRQNGYEVIRGKRLKELKLAIDEQFGDEIGFVTKTTVLGVFDFRAFLNIAMLLAESERARVLRQIILDIVIDTINKKTGGGTKYINQRDEDFIQSYFKEENYRKVFTDALKDYVEMGNAKYPIYTNKIYQCIFKEDAAEYRSILRLKSKDKTRDTFYAEILDLVAAFEYGLAEAIKAAHDSKGRKLQYWEVDELLEGIAKQPLLEPLIEKARNKMASRDLAFRDALHQQLKDYIAPLEISEFERFLGEKSKELAERLEESKDVLRRLKERE